MFRAVIFFKILPLVQAILVKKSGPFNTGPYYAKWLKITPLRAGVIRANKVVNNVKIYVEKNQNRENKKLK